jgi:tetratricopeptide (TPR) repeat protein
MRRRLDTLAVAPMMGFTTARCSDSSSVSNLRNGTELLDENRYGEAVEAFTKVIETDPPEQPLETAYWRRSLAPYESGRLEEAVSDDSALLNLTQDNPDFLPADAQLLAEAHAIRTTAHLTSGDFDNAETDLRTVIAILPEDHEWSQGEVAWRAQTGEIEPHASQQSSSAYSVDIRCIGSHVARHSVLSLLPVPRAAGARGAKAGRGDEP